MKVLIAGIATETNTFSPIPTGNLSFEETFISRTPTEEPPNLFSAPLHEWRRGAEARNWEVIESLCTAAQPAGTTVKAVYEQYRDEILEDIKTHQPDILLLSMHGAMIADGYDDCEGDLLSHARVILGSKSVIGLELDPHNHLTEQMLENADLIINYKEYPHTDSPDRAKELFALAAETALGAIKPVMRDYDCKMMSMYHTPKEPMRSFVDDMQAREGQDGILSLSLSHGFPWGDSPRVGTRMLAITDGDPAKADAVAQEFGKKLWTLREQLMDDWPTIEQSLDQAAAATEHPVVLADFADNAGGGAPSDSTFVLQEVLARKMTDIALGIYWDPVLVRMCREIGVGATLDVRLGGKVGPMSGDPVDLSVTVKALREGMSQKMGETAMPLGNCVWLETEGIHLVVSDIRSQTFHPSAFTDLGIDVHKMKTIVVKSSQHFYAGFAPIAAKIIQISGPGAIPPDFKSIAYTKRDDNFWPRTEDPFK